MTREFPKNPETPKVVEPTIGRVVYVFSGSILTDKQAKPMAAIVTDIIAGLRINACVFSGNGVPQPATNIQHASQPRHNEDAYWDWMPYQKGQAAKTEELEHALRVGAEARKIGPGGY